MFTGDILWSELDDLVKHLPMESALRTAIRDQFTDEQLADMWADIDDADRKHGSWSHLELLVAALISELRGLTFVQLGRGGVKDVQPPEPVRVPGFVKAGRKRRSAAVVAEMQAIYDQFEREEAEREAG